MSVFLACLALLGTCPTLKKTDLTNYKAVYRHIDSLSYQKYLIGKTTQKKPIYAYKLPSVNHKRTLGVVYGGVHPIEQSTSWFIYSVMSIIKKNRLSFDGDLWFIPILNVDSKNKVWRNKKGYLRHGWRRNSKRVDLNRDANRKTQLETKVFQRFILKVKPQIAVDVHQWGNVTHTPKSRSNKRQKYWGRVLTAMMRFAGQLRTPYRGVLMTWAQKHGGADSYLLELGVKTNPLIWTPSLQKKYCYYPRGFVRFLKSYDFSRNILRK